MTGVRTFRSGVEPSYWLPVSVITRSGAKKALFTLTNSPAGSNAKFKGAVISLPSSCQVLASSSARKPSLKLPTNSGNSSLWKARSKERQFAPAGMLRSRRRMETSKAPRRSIPLSEPAPLELFGPGASATLPEVSRALVPPCGGKTVVVGPTAPLACNAEQATQRSLVTMPPTSMAGASAGQGWSVTVAVSVPP